jgi:polyketide synthase PksJ
MESRDPEELLFDLLLEESVSEPSSERPGVALAGGNTHLHSSPAEENPAAFGSVVRRAAGPSAERDAPSPAPTAALSSLQERLWLVHQLDPACAAYIMPSYQRLRGPLNTAVLEKALQALWQRHDTLRTVFPSHYGQPARHILPCDALPVHAHDLTHAKNPAAWEEHYRAHYYRPLSLEAGPLMRVCLYKLAPEEHILLIDLHHINGDGVSLEILRGDLFALYEALLEGRPPILPPLGPSYGDFVAHEAAQRESTHYQAALEKRIRELAGAPTRIGFQFDHPITDQFAHRGCSVTRYYHDLALLNRAFERGRSQGLSPFMVALAAYGTLLHLHTGQECLLIGIPTSLRNSERFERTVGIFVNLCVVRLDFGGHPSLCEVMNRAGKAVREMFRCPEIPLDILAQALRAQRTPDRPPLIQAVLSFVKTEHSAQPGSKGLSSELIFLPRDTTMFELTMDLFLHGDAGLCHMEYRAGAWQEQSVRRMFDHFHAILEVMADHPDLLVGQVDLLPPAARVELNGVLNGEPLETPVCLVPDSITEHARRQPARTALVARDAQTTRSQLDNLVALRRGQLGRLGLKPGAVLALTCVPGLEWTATALAALAEAIVVLPIDANAPAARLRYILENAQAALVWHDDNFSPATAADNLPCPLLNCRAAPAAEPVQGPARARPDSTAYLIYTSGTTGQPKGVRVSHCAFATHCRSAIAAYALREDDRALVFAPANFDASWEQLFAPLVAGASVLICEAELWAPEEWCRQIAQARVTCADIPPQYLRELLFFLSKRPDCAPQSLRLIVSGGEAMPSSLAQAWLDGPLGHISLINVYGPTEGVVTTTFHHIGQGSRIATANGVVPIGKAMPGRILHILNDHGLEVGAGITGELCMGGPCLAEGYQGDEARTGTAFRHWLRTPEGGRWVEAGTPGSLRLYRSGDRVRIGPNNDLEFLGRIDRQVKLRGFRIEPAEIEAVLTRHPAIAQALVVSRDHPVSGEQLVAYCLPSGMEKPSQRELAEWLSRWLPDYMIPASTIYLPAFPTTASGKIDTAALPTPEIRREDTPQPVSSPDGLEAPIAAIWANVLGRSAVGLNDNFFDLGGHSLLLVRVHTRLVDELGAHIRLVDLFANPTVARMAKLLRGVDKRLPARRQRTHRGDVAVIGMSGRFPGAANVDDLWANLAAGSECIRFFTQAELAAQGVPETLRTRPDYVPAHGYLEGVDLFDAPFFGYTPKEAALIDPQQRLFLEEAWHALENAGCDPARHPGDIAVFGGMGLSLYLLDNLGPLMQRPERGAEAFAISLANDKDFITTRVSYKLDLRGPSVNVNTACSTSLVAIHMAAEALLRGECDVALAGGVTLSLPPVSGYLFQPGGIASPDGHCRAFADDAAGTVGGSGVGVVVLKRLEQALADGDTIHAVIKGSAINNDGADKVGFTAPGVNRQRDVIRAALDGAGVSAASIQYLEAHGTGTPMGDPIEIQALSEAFAPDRPAPQTCFVGSIKSNLGHLDTAAGVAGFIKTVLALEHGQIPPTLHCERSSAKIGFERTPFRVAQKLVPWPSNGRRRAGVSSFGIGGTNAHVVLEEAPAAGEQPPPRQDLWCLPLSARTEKSLLASAANLARHLDQHPALDAVDLWFTLSEGRRRFPVRAVVLAPSRTEAAAALRALSPSDLYFADREAEILSGNGHPQTKPLATGVKCEGAVAFAQAWLTGETSEASALMPPGPHRRIPLPTYVFDHQVCWVDPPKRASDEEPTEKDAPAKLPVGDWFYFPAWERLPARRAETASKGPIVVVHDGSVIELRWLDALRSAGMQFTACLGGEGLEGALAALARRQTIPAQAWHLATLGFATGGPAEYAQRLDALLSDLRALAAAWRGQPSKLLLLTPQAGGPDAAADPNFAYLDAVCAVMPHEYGSIAVKVLRVDPAALDAASLSAVRSVAGLTDGARSLALWRGKLWQRTFSKLPAGSSNRGAARLRPEGVYLITGGLGGLGLAVAGYLARTCKARLVLVSRHEPEVTHRQAISAMEAEGARVRTAALDIADAAALRALLDDVCAHWGPLDGVIHAAGIAGGSLVARTHLAEIEPVLRAKVAGTEALAAALQGREPPFVILCSSLTASLGGAGQSAYAAANAWLDAFATAQSVGKPGVWTSVEWDSWAEVGMAARAAGGPPSTSTTHTLLKECLLSPASYWPWGEHRIGGVATLPGSAYLELFAQALGGGALEIGPVVLVEPMVCDGENSRTVRVLRGGDELVFQSFDGIHLREHARAHFRGTPAHPSSEPLAAIQARCTAPMVPAKPDAAPGIFIGAGPRWAIEVELQTGRDEALAKLQMPARFAGDLAEYPLHPAVLDVALSYYITCIEDGTAFLPWRYEKVRVYAPLQRTIFSYARLRSRSERSLVLDAELRDQAGRLLAQVEGYTLLRSDPQGGARHDRRRMPTLATNPFAITPAEGVEAFLRALDTAEPVVCVSTVAWKHAAVPVALAGPVHESGAGRSEASRKPRPEITTPFRAAGTEAEKIMAGVWEEVLGYQGLGIDDDLFDLGADSLTALQASARWKEVRGSEFSLDDFFAQATIANLAKDLPDQPKAEPAFAAAGPWEEGDL